MKNIDSRKVEAHRLSGWQAIAGYFQRNPSTVRRWAAEHGLPIHRPSGTMARKGAAVFAYPSELDDWLRRFTLNAGGSAPATEPQHDFDIAVSAATALKGGPYWGWLGLGAAVFALSLAGLLFWSQGEGRFRQPAAQVQASSEVNRNLYTDASYLVEKRTPESLSQAVILLEQLTHQDPQYGAAWSVLATAFNLMVEYGQIDPQTGYDRSHAAAERALALNPSLASAQAVLADLDFFWFRSLKTGLAGFERAAALDPSDAQALHWYASALALSGEPSRALIEIRKAKYADPSSRSIRVSEAIVLLSGGQVDAAGDALQSLLRYESTYPNPYRFLAFVQLARADYGGYLDAWSRRFELKGDAAGLWIIQAGRDGLATNGRDGMIAAMVAAMAPSAVQNALEPYFLAHLNALSGVAQHAIDALGQVATRHAFYYSIDPAFSQLRQQPVFQDALQAMNLPAI